MKSHGAQTEGIADPVSAPLLFVVSPERPCAGLRRRARSLALPVSSMPPLSPTSKAAITAFIPRRTVAPSAERANYALFRGERIRGAFAKSSGGMIANTRIAAP